MIIRNRPSFLRLFFSMRGSVVPRIAPNMAAISALAAVVVLAERTGYGLPHVSLEAMSVFGLALSLFLGFRNNAAYDRWWEARILWGQLISDMRSMARETRIYLRCEQTREEIISLCCAFAHFHRARLRNTNAEPEVLRWIGIELAAEFASAPNPACEILNRIANRLCQVEEMGRLSGFAQRAFSDRLARISDAQAGCERIASTPLPFVYSLLVRRTTYLYCIILPFGLTGPAGWLSPLFAVIAAYVFFGLAAVTDELEMPFGATENGLPLDAMCRIIEISADQAMSRTPLPALAPKDLVLT